MRKIEARSSVHLSCVDLDRWRFLSVAGRVRIVRDVDKKGQLWQKELEQWFEGPESDAIVLIKVTPTLISSWTKSDAGEVRIR